MIQLTDEQIESLEGANGTPPEVVNPRTQEIFVLLRVEEYKRLTDDEPYGEWTQEDRYAIMWDRIERGDWEYAGYDDDNAGPKP